MAKMLASSLSLRLWLESLEDTEIYDFRIEKKGLHWGGWVFEGEGQGEDIVFLNKIHMQAFIKILKNLFDQPILLRIDDGKLWLMQCILN
jgi:hypothetical protein